MEGILQKILGAWQDDTRFIFPSEVVAESWRYRLLEQPGVSALPEERFISWDRFKERYSHSESELLPSNDQIRKLFAERIVNRFSSGELLFQHLLPSDHPASARAFLPWVSSILPKLHGLLLQLGDSDDRLVKEYVSELALLHGEYREFLQLYGIYEPTWTKREIDLHGRCFFFFLPELVDDIDEYREVLSETPGMELIPADLCLPREGATLSTYDNSLEELEELCNYISGLLDRGCKPWEIAITLGDPDLLPLLERTARRLDLPLTIRIQKSLCDYGAGRLLSYMMQCRESHFSLESLKLLLLNRGLPWQNRNLCERLIVFGGANHCVQNLGDGPEGDLWETMFRIALKNSSSRDEVEGSISDTEELHNFYSSLRGMILKIAGATSFASLRASLEGFLRQFLVTDGPSEDRVRPLQRIRVIIDELVWLEERLGGMVPESPFQFLVEELQSTGYLLQDANEGAGIPVYPYRVSAGIYPNYHIMPGLSQKATSVKITPIPSFGDSQLSLLGLKAGDLTQHYLSVYLSSGENVSASFARETSMGVQLPPGALLANGKIKKAENTITQSPYTTEEKYWRGESQTLLPTLCRYQKCGIRILMTEPRELDLTKASLSVKLLERQDGSHPLHRDGLVRISPYRLDRWKTCPTAYLFSYGWELDTPPVTASWESALMRGKLMHEILHRLFDRMREKSGTAPLKRRSELLNQAIREVSGYWERTKSFGRTPFWKSELQRIVNKLHTFLEKDLEGFPLFTPEDLEWKHEVVDEEKRLLYSGKIDRISGTGDELVVVDYKSSFNTPLAGILSEDGEPFSFQMPIYLLLLSNRQNAEPDASDGAGSIERRKLMVYYDLSRGRFVSFLDSEQKGLEQKVIDYLEKFAEGCAAMVLNGEFMPPEECDGCEYRSVCRVKYFIRSGDRR